jgi:hypothetical protein
MAMNTRRTQLEVVRSHEDTLRLIQKKFSKPSKSLADVSKPDKQLQTVMDELKELGIELKDVRLLMVR